MHSGADGHIVSVRVVKADIALDQVLEAPDDRLAVFMGQAEADKLVVDDGLVGMTVVDLLALQ